MLDVLHAFRDQVNADPEVQRVVRDWTTRLLLEESDSGRHYRIGIERGRIADVQRLDGPDDDEAPLRIVAPAAVMRGVFEGRVSGIRANNDGLLAVYGSMDDQVRMDAIALILWGC